MKKFIAMLLLLSLALSASAFALEIDYASLTDEELTELISDATAERNQRQPAQEPHVPAAINASPDKYTWYIQDYVGRNAAGFGYTSLDGDRLDHYGAGYLELTFLAEDGAWIDISDEEQLKQYVVTGQNIEPNTELKLSFQTDSNGKEYSNLVEHQSIESIDLAVRRIDGTMLGDPVTADLVPINPSPDKYTWYIRNYVGKNVASCGYTSLGGDRMDAYGAGHLRFNLIADDGAYLDPEDKEQLRQYVVTGQDLAPNTEMKLVFLKDSEDNEYSNLIDSQSFESITLYVHHLDIDYPESVESE